MSNPPIDERYELAAVKQSLTTDDRKAAEHAYTVSAFDYENAPIGSRDWTLFWSGWQKRAALNGTPPADAALADEIDALARRWGAGVFEHRLLTKAAAALRARSASDALLAEAVDVLHYAMWQHNGGGTAMHNHWSEKARAFLAKVAEVK